MAKLTLQEQLLQAGLVTSKKMAKVQRTAKNHAFRLVRPERRWKKIKRRNLSVINNSVNSKTSGFSERV